METNRKLCMCEFFESLKLEEGPIPKAEANGAVIKVSYAGVCHTDLHIWHEELADACKGPRILGHEVSGVIQSMGEDVKNGLKIGDRVCVYPWAHCGKCDFCTKGSHLCPNRFPTHKTDPEAAPNMYGLSLDGAYQSYLAIHDASLIIPIPDELPLDEACLIPCGGITAHSAVLKIKPAVESAIQITGHANIALFGAGGLCYWAIQICKAIFPSKITVCVVDLKEEKLKDAIEWGADVTVCWSKDSDKTPDAVAQMIGVCKGRLNAAIDFTSFPETYTRFLGAAQVGAALALVGLGKHTVQLLPIVALALMEISTHGVYVGPKQSVKPPKIEHVKLEEVEEILRKMIDGMQNRRAVVKM